jgi:hypothetical protein
MATVPSPPPTARRVPSWLKAMCTLRLGGPGMKLRLSSTRPAGVTCQILTRPSSPPVSRNRPSGEKLHLPHPDAGGGGGEGAGGRVLVDRAAGERTAARGSDVGRGGVRSVRPRRRARSGGRRPSGGGASIVGGGPPSGGAPPSGGGRPTRVQRQRHPLAHLAGLTDRPVASDGRPWRPCRRPAPTTCALDAAGRKTPASSGPPALFQSKRSVTASSPEAGARDLHRGQGDAGIARRDLDEHERLPARAGQREQRRRGHPPSHGHTTTPRGTCVLAPRAPDAHSPRLRPPPRRPPAPDPPAPVGRVRSRGAARAGARRSRAGAVRCCARPARPAAPVGGGWRRPGRTACAEPPSNARGLKPSTPPGARWA